MHLRTTESGMEILRKRPHWIKYAASYIKWNHIKKYSSCNQKEYNLILLLELIDHVFIKYDCYSF